MNEKDYIANRLNGSFGRGNDRLSREKQMADAVLRGKLGTQRASKIIGLCDEIKYGHNSYKERY